MKLLLICNGGVSTSILAANVKLYSDENDSIEVKPLSQFESNQITYDVILIAPQIRYMYDEIVKRELSSVIGVMDEIAYGKMDGEAVFMQANKLALSIKPKKGEKRNMKDLKITLCCNGGVSSKMLCKKIIAAGEKNGFQVECDAYSTSLIDEKGQGSVLILVGPQVKYMASTIQQKFPEIPVEVISMSDYGSMAGEKIFEDMLAKYNWKRGLENE